jgi:hypothetical protein
MKRLFAACLVAAILAPATASAKDSVSGTFTAKGETTPFAYVYAFRKADSYPPDSKPNLYVLLSDKPVPAAAIPKDDDGIAKMAALVRDDAIHAIELRFVGDDTSQLNDAQQGAVYNKAISPGRNSVAGLLQYVTVKGAPKTISGKLSTTAATGSARDWSCEALFEVALPAR